MDMQDLDSLFRKGLPINTSTNNARDSLKNLMHNANENPDENEFKRIEQLVKIEKEWWSDFPAYKSTEQILNDFKNGKIKKIESNKNYKLIMRLENPDFKEWLPYLGLQAAELLKKVGAQWREKMREKNLPGKIQLAITNLLITTEYKSELIKKGKLAIKGSSHTKGKSFDIDGCGYYLNGKSVNPRQTKDYNKIYNKRVHKILLEVLEEMQGKNYLNFILEFLDTNNQSFHITVSPGYEL